MRVRGQVHALEVALPEGPLGDARAALLGAFSERYVAAYGVAPNPTLQLTALRVRLVRSTGMAPPTSGAVEPADRPPDSVTTRPAYFTELGDFVATPVFDWTALVPGECITGPAIVQAPDTTVVVPPARNAVLDGGRNLVLHR
jgi:N-methylhydantoinase A